ncbi:uncharacterized protein [Lolium perenne]|uniref:uncharacterized protein n=1 Tax=Lolium perenne TaxID=4522 RepID=UPI0021F5A821|nr:uncharacterized protein LOC127307197 [Lolium perenne]
MAPPLHFVPRRSEGTGGCASSSSPSSPNESSRDSPIQRQIRRYPTLTTGENGQFRPLEASPILSDLIDGSLELDAGGTPATPWTPHHHHPVPHVLPHPRRRLARPGLAGISRFVLDCELSHGVFVPDLRLVLGQNGCASRSNQNPSLQLSDPWMGLGPGSLPGVSPLSCASSSLDPAQKTAQHLLLPDRIAKWCGEIRQVLRMFLGKL